MTENRKPLTPEGRAAADKAAAEAKRQKGRIPFEPAGEGAFFFFRMSDLVSLEGAHESKWQKETPFGYFEKHVRDGSAAVISDCIEAGLKVEIDRKPVPVTVNFDDISFAPADAADPIIRALCVAYYGITFDDLLEKIRLDRVEFERNLNDEEAN